MQDRDCINTGLLEVSLALAAFAGLILTSDDLANANPIALPIAFFCVISWLCSLVLGLFHISRHFGDDSFLKLEKWLLLLAWLSVYFAMALFGYVLCCKW